MTCSGSTGFPFILLAADKTALASSIRPLIERKIQLSRPGFLFSHPIFIFLTFTFILLGFRFSYPTITLSSCFHLRSLFWGFSINLPCNQPSRRLWKPVEKNYTNSHHCRDDLRKVKQRKSEGKHFEILFKGMKTSNWGMGPGTLNVDKTRTEKHQPEGEYASP